jgi:hypothetical protein
VSVNGTRREGESHPQRLFAAPGEGVIGTVEALWCALPSAHNPTLLSPAAHIAPNPPRVHSQPDVAERYLCLAFAGDGDLGWMADPAPGSVQGGVLPETGFVGKNQRPVLGAGFFLRRG